MNSPNSLYRFRVGIKKDKPLDTSGLPWKIITYDGPLQQFRGKELAQFQNGQLAEFYVNWDEPPSPPPAVDLTQPREEMWCEAWDTVDLPTVPLQVSGPVERQVSGKRTIGKLKMACFALDHEPVYVIMQQRQSQETFTRAEVGTGVREYLWLYAKYRELGHGRLASMYRAWDVYSL